MHAPRLKVESCVLFVGMFACIGIFLANFLPIYTLFHPNLCCSLEISVVSDLNECTSLSNGTICVVKAKNTKNRNNCSQIDESKYICDFNEWNELSEAVIQSTEPQLDLINPKGTKACSNAREIARILNLKKCRGSASPERVYRHMNFLYHRKFNGRNTLLREDEVIAICMPILLPAAVAVLRHFTNQGKEEAKK